MAVLGGHPQSDLEPRSLSRSTVPPLFLQLTASFHRTTMCSNYTLCVGMQHQGWDKQQAAGRWRQAGGKAGVLFMGYGGNGTFSHLRPRPDHSKIQRIGLQPPAQ